MNEFEDQFFFPFMMPYGEAVHQFWGHYLTGVSVQIILTLLQQAIY